MVLPERGFYGFQCCDLPWHNRVGKRYAMPDAPPTEARAWADAFANAKRSAEGFYFSDILCELATS